MAIRFYCQRCGQLLSIASRKAGTYIDCPKCAANQEVPSQEAGDAAISLAMASKVEKKAPDASAKKPEETRKAEDDFPEAVITAPPLHVAPYADKEIHVPAGDDYIVLPRRTIYLQGLLFVIVAILSLGMGILIGRGVGAGSSNTDDSAEAAPVLLEGHLTFQSSNGPPRPDHNAAIIVLPELVDVENAQSAPRIPCPGLRSLDPPPSEDYGSLRRIRELGGCYARADEEGNFSLVLPDRGRYHLLLISRGGVRAEDSKVDESDLDTIAHFFRRPIYLIGGQKYRLTLEKFEDRAQIEYNFE
ncbi:MAG: hypothetical protein JXM70_16180 [Pirellulales bacterium]|nr:hypothetical protein [Pirellulales bacterium]